MGASGTDAIARFNATAVDFGEVRSVVEHVAERAAAGPGELALADADGTLTREQLDLRTNALARVLRAHGAAPERCVAICVNASARMVVGALATLKAGAAYVPVDPDYPQERIELILEDTDPIAVLVDATTPAAVLAIAGQRAIALDHDPADLDAAGRESSALAGPPPAPDSLAYVVYTSGSTGRPKGAEVEHRSLINLALAEARDCGTTEADRMAQTAAPAFDATVMEIWHPLVVGASLHIAPNKLRRDPRKLVRWLAEREITLTMVPTALVAMLFEHGALYRELSVRRLLTGGAALLTRPASDAGFELVNMYGPTECTVVATQGVVPASGDQPPTIGGPLANTRIYILDPERSPVGVGELGEIWIGGVQVARGYRGRPDLTAERFVDDPFAVQEGGRMYRTGDRAIWQESGEIEFHGRVDDQISIRGYRIEPQEVEAALTSMDAIVDAVVIAVSHGRRGDQLAAYYTTEGSPPSVAEVRAHARSILPEYMAPTAYTQLEEFALTPNGKIDRKGLPAPLVRRADLDTAIVAPSGERETVVAQAFAEVLEMDEVGAADDFFALGGDSLDAVECVSAVGEALGLDVDVAVETLYANPTVTSLVAAIDGTADAADQIDWTAEAEPGLDGVGPVARTEAAGGRSVALTGATGFLGPHLVASLLATTRADGGRVIALVRAQDDRAARERLERALVAERHDLGADADRLVVLAGDLAAPRWGLDEAAFDRLAGSVDALFHNGATVHHLQDYSRLRAANVGGTREALRLALMAGGVPFHLVSSISTTLEVRDGTLSERDDAESRPLDNGYAATKWVAERMALAAADSYGLPVRIVRLPRVMGARGSGAMSTTDAVMHLLRGCIELGAYPRWPGWEPWAPVDVLEAALADSPFELEAGAAIVYPPATIAGFEELFRAAAAYGYELEPLSVAAWRERLGASSSGNMAAAIAAEFGLYEAGAQTIEAGRVGSAWDLQPQLDGPPVDPIGHEYVWRMLDYLISVGEFPRP